MPTKPRVYFDSCCFIEMAKTQILAEASSAEAHEVWFCKQLILAARKGDILAYTSMLSINECLFVRSPKNKEIITDDVKRLFSGLLTSGRSGIIPVEPTLFVLERARDLAWVHGLKLKPLDSIHVASAIEMKCSEFLTFDERLLKKSRKFIGHGLSITRPSKTGSLPEDYRQLKINV